MNPIKLFIISCKLFLLCSNLAYSHNGNPHSSNAASNPGNSTNAPVDNTTKLLKAHGVILTLAWGVIIKISIFTAAFMQSHEKFGSTSSTNKPGLWFRIHQCLNILVTLLTLTGILLSFAANQWKWIGNINGATDTYSKTMKSHVIIGITVGCLCFVNLLAGIFRPSKNADSANNHNTTKMRKIWEYSHKIAGYLTLILADVAIFLGLFSLPSPRF